MPGPNLQLFIALIAAAGAFLVACVTGGFSLLGLIISKEQQVSGFRQTWIDALRGDLAILVAHAYRIQSFAALHKPLDLPKFWETTGHDYIEMNQASIRIKLRLNPEEDESKAVLQVMTNLEELFRDVDHPLSTEKIDEIVDGVEKRAPALLKKEWNRVKKGETIYRVAKCLAAGIFLVAAAAAALLLWKIRHLPTT